MIASDGTNPYTPPMQLSEFDYHYPLDLIAQEPLPERDASRLLVLDRTSGNIQHEQMRSLPHVLAPNDLLIVNNSRVLPMRIHGTRANGSPVELLLLEEVSHEADSVVWRGLATKMKRLQPGDRLQCAADLTITVLAREDDTLQLRFSVDRATLRTLLDRIGTPPLPPYITRAPAPSDRARYQTVFAAHDGSAAAPTAGLHFSEALLAQCRDRGIGIAYVTLHVGLDTFQPIRVEDLTQHRMHGEFFHIPQATRDAIIATQSRGGRIIAVGTTAVRALESYAQLQRAEGITQLFITPGYQFQLVDALVTNFHQPRTTLLALVSAFAALPDRQGRQGRERILAAYREAIAQRYRLFSYGDAMLILDRA